MRRVRLGRTDLRVSRIGLGTLAFGHGTKGIQDKGVIRKCLNRAFDGGINLIDTAEEYAGGAAESHVGDVLRQRGDREEMVLVTKVSYNHLGYEDVLKAARRSLKRLRTDRIDIYMVHWPNCYFPISETMRAMDRLLEEGKIRYVGLSNYHNALVREAMGCLRNGEIAVNEIEYSLARRDIEKEMLPFLRREGLSVLAYSPLMSGFLSLRHDERTRFPKDDFRNRLALFKDRKNYLRSRRLFEAMREVADDHGVSPSEVALNWLMRDEDVIPIPGAKSAAQVEVNIHSATWRLTRKEAGRLSEASQGLELDRD